MSHTGSRRPHNVDSMQHVPGCQCDWCLEHPKPVPKPFSRRNIFITWALLTGAGLIISFWVTARVFGSPTVQQLSQVHTVEVSQDIFTLLSFLCILSLLWHLLKQRSLGCHGPRRQANGNIASLANSIERLAGWLLRWAARCR